MKPLPSSFYDNVRQRLRERAQGNRLDGLLLLGAGNVGYATGWHFSVNERPMGLWLPVDGAALLLVPHLELENAMEVPGVEVRTYDEFPGERPPVLWMIEEAGAKQIAVDRLDANLLAPARASLTRLDLVDHAKPERAVKDGAELGLIREAARFADMVLERLLGMGGDIIQQGGTEEDLLEDCTGHVRKLLSATHGEAFQGTQTRITASVHSGSRAALPHGSVTARRPLPGDPIVAGIGCSLGGYHAESGATLVLGEIRPEQRRVMEAMAEAGAATVHALERGWTCSKVNEAALAPIRGAGLADSIRHRIGHGMGVEGHEAPWLAPGDHTPTAPGMVFSCEPGVYRPGLDGWRTIDTLVVGHEMVELASRFQTRHPLETRTLSC
ncbi:MAG: M24 family metallopeptidase [Longimicrobiales bacterium]|nr:M24 family metallopeptidase [Longimicrobiales bacterium]